MASILPISSTRVTSTMMRNQLSNQVQYNQLELFRLQNQLSTGLRIFLPSDDPASAQRAIVLQRTLERNAQSLSNLQGAEISLATTESVLATSADNLNSLKAEALSVLNTISSEEERLGVVNDIDALLDELVRVGNANFATNFLLGGAERSTEAYQQVGTYIEYLGDESTTQTFIDIGELFDQGVSGNDVLGGLSDPVRSVADLDPQLTLDTKLTQLEAGVGLNPSGSIEITYVPALASLPNQTTAVDLSSAKSIEDLVRLIETGAPADSGLVVSIEGDSLRIDIPDGTFQINEVGNGSIAQELGIATGQVAVSSVTGGDLNPTIEPTTSLDDLMGAKAQGRIVSLGNDNDISLVANANGADLNGLEVYYVDGAAAGAESATFTPGVPPTLTVTIADGESTAADVAGAISAEGTFTAEVDYRDQTTYTSRGQGVVTASATTNLAVNVTGGADGSLDLASGLLVTNGTETYTIDTSTAETVEDLLSLLNDPAYGLLAEINESGTAIDLRTRRSGADFAIGENGGTTATDLGIRSYTEDSRLEDFNRGVGVIIPGETDDDTRAQNVLEITVVDQGASTTYSIDPVGLDTVQDVIDAIAATTGGAVTASLATSGNGLVLTRTDAVDAAAPATGTTTLLGDTLTLTADNPGSAGNATYNIEIVDNGAGGLSTTVDGDTILVDLGGSATETTASIAASISAELPDHTLTSSGTDPVTAPVTSFAATAAGGYEADELTVSGTVAERLGFLPEGEDSVTTTTASVTSTDRNPDETDSVFTTLLRMREALLADDPIALGAEVDRLDVDLDRITFARAEIGVRLQNLESVADRLTQEEITLQAALSDEIDADLVQVISDYTAQQYALEASLQTSGALLNLTILNFI